MALPDRMISAMVDVGSLIIRPFRKECLNPAGYDLTCGSGVAMDPGESALTCTEEYLELPLDVVGFLFIRSTLAREGIVPGLAVVDPGFRGQLTILLYNVGNVEVEVREGERFLQIVFIRLLGPPGKGYEGAYQDSVGVVGSRRGGE